MVRVIIQARMLSSRLRGKTLMSIAGTPLLYRVVDAVKKFRFVDDIVIATTRDAADNPIATAANNLGVGIYRGNSVNVLKRFKDATADMDEEDTIVRITADNIFYNKEISVVLFNIHNKGGFDYTYVEGLSHVVPEFVKVKAIRKVFEKTNDDYDTEHVTPYLRNNPDFFSIKGVPADFMGLEPSLSKLLTIDTKDDFERVSKIYNELFNKYNRRQSLGQIYNWLKNNGFN